jgi:Cytochrome C oxidase, cbb3-type, subunit III
MKNRSCFGIIIETIALLFISHSALAENETGQMKSETEYYRVVNDKVDADTFVGYNAYHHACVACHGVGGQGSDQAPDLTASLEYLSLTQFKIKVLHKFAVKFSIDEREEMEQAIFTEIRKQQHRDQGKLANMPRWENNPMVNQNIQNIYRYLKARSDGVIGEDKPGLLKD